jgi:GNAT superfamily N-acetyltransferase
VSIGLERISVDDVDLALAERLATVQNAALAEVPLRRHTPETFLLDVQDHNGEGPWQALWLARVDGVPVGWSGVHLNLFENLDGAKVLGGVHPDHQRRGLGRALMEAVEAATDRARLRAPTWVGTAGERAVPRLGYTAHSSHEVRRLWLHDSHPPELVAAAETAAADYDLERFVGPCPEPLLADLRILRETINDAPEDGEFEAYPPDRIRRYEQWLAGQKQTAYTLVARHRATGEAAGLTIVCVYELTPSIAAQEDTSVVAGHRGHRLGLRMKLAMLDWLRAERPDVEAVDTWNAPGNAPMIAINEALGCRKVAETVRFVKQR